MKIIAPKRLMESVFPTVRNGGIFNASSLDLQFARTKTLDPRVTFTRASSGTFVGSDGLIKTATTNLLLQSNGFDTTWTNFNSSETAAAGTAPDGTNTAWTFTDTVDVSPLVHELRQANIAGTSGLSYTYSVYAKAGTLPELILLFPSAIFGATIATRFNLSDGSIASAGVGTTNSIVSVGGGWYRLMSTLTATTSATGTYTLRLGNGSGGTYQGDGTGTILIWGAQLEQSSTVGEYIPTTSTINSAPRFDHNPTTGESLGLLVEEARTNFATQSESFSGWTVGNLVQSTATVTSPSGGSTAQLFVEDTATSPHRLFLSPTTGQLTNSFSVWVKPASGTRSFYIESDGPTGTRRTLRFNLQAGTVDLAAGDWTNLFITAYANGWFKVGGTITDNGGSVLFIVGSSNGAVSSYTGDGTSGFYLWGAQLEAGAFPTSYIPTTSSTVTRSADVASITGANFSSWYRQDEGTVFADVAGIYNTAAAFTLSDGTNNNRILLDHGTNTRRSRIVTGGADQASLTSSYVYGSPIKSTVAYALDNSALASNGSLSANSPDTSCTIPTAIDRLNIGSNVGSAAQAGTSIRRLTYWPTRLENEVLQTITQ
jgi:hypothetical protein